MAKLYPYLSFENAKEALEYYEEVFGAEKTFRVPANKDQAESFQLSEDELENATIHGGFSILGTELFCSDCFGYSVEKGNQITLMLDIDSEDEKASKDAEQFFDKISASDSVQVLMPYEDQFWGGKMGNFVDKYGIQWMLHAQEYSKIENN